MMCQFWKEKKEMETAQKADLVTEKDDRDNCSSSKD